MSYYVDRMISEVERELEAGEITYREFREIMQEIEGADA